MLIIGERINTSRKGLDDAVARRDEAFFQNLARTQVQAGATYLDVNVGTRVGTEIEDIVWMVQLVQRTVDVPCSIDTPNPTAAAAALKVHKGRAIVNSISAESKRYSAMIPLLKEYGCGVVALCVDDEGVPETTEAKVRVGRALIERLLGDGVKPEDMYVDLLVQPVSTNSQYGVALLRAIEKIKELYPHVHASVGLSNVSYGLPQRKLLNRAFAIMCIAAGIDTAIIDPNDQELMQQIIVAEALAGRDEFCMRYLEAARDGRLGPPPA